MDLIQHSQDQAVQARIYDLVVKPALEITFRQIGDLVGSKIADGLDVVRREIHDVKAKIKSVH